MHRVLWLLLFLLTVPVHAAEVPRPNTLTPQEIAEGWILLFDGETTYGWAVDGQVKVQDGALVLGGDKPTTSHLTTTLRDYNITFQFSVDGLSWGTGHIDSSLFKEGKRAWGLGTQGFPSTSGLSLEKLFGTAEKRGNFPIQLPDGKTFYLRNVKLHPLGTKSLFNGKDLTGWKKFLKPPRDTSQFSVTKEGWLHIQNGPGDLQTEGQWDNFLLQIDCFTNGKDLNSGVFFRCRPDEYQQGYEAQIFNRVDKPKDYIVDEYDPKTNALKGKKIVRSTAGDYGTGAIYRRIPAHKQAARDKEWFTMTVAAQGRHISTWVNGYQVVDWTDHRPLKDNAPMAVDWRKGPSVCRDTTGRPT